MASHGVPRITGSQVGSEQSRLKELQHITEYKKLVSLVNIKAAERQYTAEVLALTTQLLTENAEYYTIWNHRRRILEHMFTQPSNTRPSTSNSNQNILDLLTNDLRWLVSLLRQLPKCYCIWNHRLWLLQEAEILLPAATTRNFWHGELELVGKMLRLDSRNFHAWGYRRFVVTQIVRIPVSGSTPGDASQSMVEAEFEYTTKMIKTNLSNFSAWHNRSKLIPRLLSHRQANEAARREMLDAELSQIQAAINTDPFDQSIWFYHQFLMSTLSPNDTHHAVIALELTKHDQLRYYEQEMEGIRDILEDTKDCKWIYEALLQYASSYLEIGGSNQNFTTIDMQEWLSKLRELDPLRKHRWDDLERSLAL
ncbi:protein prenylyltransferase [Cenococcum geophilum 1.58]|uniref:protein prenylyltransferase n=1 Tax=Cenococcum geophilum 1.58 TaxID=794803 RepID=UPI00358DE0AE|nr:protein prenylyltransferase [Cenococcum geophilum 1.58]